jgi:hypothetical protein
VDVAPHASLAVLEQYEENPYAVRLRLRFVLKRRLHQDSIEARTRYPGSHSMKRRALMKKGYSNLVGKVSDSLVNTRGRAFAGGIVEN